MHTHIAVVLLCKDFFLKETPRKKLRQILDDHSAFRDKLVPVFLGMSVEECEKLAKKAGLAGVCAQSGMRHAYERGRFQGRLVHREETMQRVVWEICRMLACLAPVRLTTKVPLYMVPNA